MSSADEQTRDEAPYDVVVVGCGLVGATVANFLGQWGVRTLVIERELAPYPTPRAIVLDDEVLRILQALGLGDRLGELTAPLEHARYINGAGRTLFDIPLKDTETVSGNPFVNSFYQPELEGALRERLASQPSVTLRLGHEVETLTQDEAAAHLTARDLASGQTWATRARYALGCDSARSFTRKTLGITLQDFHQDAAWLVIDAEAIAADPFPMWNYQVCDPARPCTFVHGKGKHLRWEFKLRPNETREEITRPERMRELIRNAPTVGIDPDLLAIQRSAVYTFHATIAERWRVGRVFLLGDAAHQMPPFLGQGSCAGFRDAMNLAWKLRLVLQGQMSEHALASYESERRPHVQGVIQRAITMGSVIQTTNRVQAWVRDHVLALRAALGHAEMPATTFPPLTEGILAAQGTPRTDTPRSRSASRAAPAMNGRGTPLAQRPVTQADGHIVRLDEALGDSFALVAYQCDPAAVLAPELLARFRALGGRVVQIAPPEAGAVPAGAGSGHDHTGALGEWFASHTAEVALARPDRYLFGEATLAQTPALLRDLLAQLSAPVSAAR